MNLRILVIALPAITTACLDGEPIAAVSKIDRVCKAPQQAVLDARGVPDSVNDQQSDTLLVNHIAGINYWYADSVYSFGDSAGVCTTTRGVN
jgi:hypothetical protein